MTPFPSRTALPALVGLGFVASVSTSAHAQARYQATNLGSLGGTTTLVTSMNEAGDAAGGASVPVAGGALPVQHPVIFSNGVLTSPGLPPGAPRIASFSAINAGGQAAGTFRRADDTTGGFVYSGGAFTPLPVPAGAALLGVGDLNDAGHAVGSLTLPEGNRPYLYANGALTPLERTGGGAWGAGAINNAGQVVGNYFVDVNGQRYSRGVIWAAGQTTEIPLPAGFAGVTADDINELGHVSGYLTKLVSNGDDFVEQRQPFLYRDGVVTALPQVFDATHTYANAVNDRGDIVGFYGSGFTEAVLYSRGAYTNLNELVTLPDGFRLVSATDINNVGQILAVARRSPFDIEIRSYLLTPVPEPGVGAVLFATAPLMLARRRRRH